MAFFCQFRIPTSERSLSSLSYLSSYLFRNFHCQRATESQHSFKCSILNIQHQHITTMPALVANPETPSYYASMAHTPFKHYETRNSPSAPQVESDHGPKFNKSSTPDLVMENVKALSIKTSVAAEEEAKSIIEPISAAALMSEDAAPCDQHTPSEFHRKSFFAVF